MSLEAGGREFPSAALEGLTNCSPSKLARWFFGRHAISSHVCCPPLPPQFYYISLFEEKEIVIGEREEAMDAITPTSDGVPSDVRRMRRATLWHDATAIIAKRLDVAFYNCFIIQEEGGAGLWPALEAGGREFPSATLEGLTNCSPSKVARWFFG